VLDHVPTGPNPIREFSLEVTIIIGQEVNVRLQKTQQEGMAVGSGPDYDE
jgi:hypothetical protein